MTGGADNLRGLARLAFCRAWELWLLLAPD
jgi:hypothetical protein